MSLPPHEEALKAYIARILAVKADQSATLSADALRAIALDLGLSEADLAAGVAEAARYHQRGLGFLRHQRWADAVEELSAANALAPDDLDILHALASAHAGLWHHERHPASREAAEALARRCLDLAPDHEPSFVLLNALDAPNRATRPNAPRSWLKPALVLGLSVAVLLGVMVAWERRPAPVASVPRPSGAKPAPLVEVPVSLVSDAKSAGIRLEARLSQLSNYETSSYYKQAIALTNTGATEWQALTLQAEYLDAAGAVIARKPISALADHKASVRPGDVHLFNDLQRATPRLHHVRLRVLVRQEVPIRAAKLVPRPLAPTWATEAPAGVKLAFRERSGAVSRHAMFTTVYVKPVVEIENTGAVTVKTLRMAISLYDAKDRLLGTRDHLVVSGEGMALPPGETRLDNWIEQAPTSYHHHRLSVVEVE
jgi:hypothetical protein